MTKTISIKEILKHPKMKRFLAFEKELARKYEITEKNKDRNKTKYKDMLRKAVRETEDAAFHLFGEHLGGKR